jgi:CRP-like cAMP-binding protein
MQYSSLPANQVVFKEGNKADKLFLVKTGQVLCLKFSKDRLIPVFVARPGDIIGESAMITEKEYTYSAISLSYVDLVAVPDTNFKQVFKQAPEWIEGLMDNMINRFHHTSSLIAENRIMNSKIFQEDDFGPEIEVVFKKLLS